MRAFDPLRLLVIVAACFVGACGPSKYLVTRPPPEPFDAVVLPGCPSEENGSPSRCQMGRAGHGALLWREGWTKNFIVSGSDVHTPYVEAEAIAQAMTVLGVPPERILLERDALHSDENVYYPVLLAKRLGLNRLAVATNGPVAGWMCSFMEKFGHDCFFIKMDTDALEKFLPAYEPTLRALRARKTENWEPLSDRESRIAEINGYGRPPSWFLYPFYGWIGASHKPIAPAHPEAQTWSERLQELGQEAGGQ